MKMKDFNINMTQYHAGDIITGTIVMIGSSEVVVAIGGLKEGVFPIEELDSSAFKLGDAILVMVTGEVDDKGCLVLTHAGVNKAIEDKEKLKNLKVGSTLSFKVNAINSAGLLGDFMGYSVFVPFSQCSPEDYINKENLVNREINVKVIELNNIKKSIVCSSKLMSNSKIEPVANGDIVKGIVIKLEDRFAIVLLKNGMKAKISIQDVAYRHLNSVGEVLNLNEEYEFKVLDVNTDYSRINVGLKQLQNNPVDEIYDKLTVGDMVEGQVVKILPVGAVIKLDNGLTALAVTKENSDRANVATHHLYKLNSRVKGEICYIDKENHKINILTNKKADN